MEFSLEQWWAFDEDTRAVMVDAVLERIPRGYRDHREGGHRGSPLPAFVHEETGMLFHVVFGGRAVFGMSDRRWARMNRLRLPDGDLDELSVVPNRAEAAALEPAREVLVKSALVADQPLPFGVLRKLGLDEARLASSGFHRVLVGAVLRAVTRLGWRAPSEADWEYAVRAVADTVDDAAPLRSAPSRLMHLPWRRMGEHYELCSDDFHESLAGYPAEGGRGRGHAVVRGRGNGRTFVGWSEAAAWSEAVWPGRASLASVTQSISFRPWVDLLVL